MKTFHTLKARWLLAAMAGAVIIGETIAWFVTSIFNWRFPVTAVAAVCIGLVAVVVTEFYDGND